MKAPAVRSGMKAPAVRSGMSKYMNDRSKTSNSAALASERDEVEAMQELSAPVQHSPFIRRAPNRLASFRYAFAGIDHLFRTQRNAQIHVAISIAVVIAGLLFRIERLEWLALILTIMLVLAAEGINTAIEAVVDLASPQRHPLAKIAKDVAAGTVLLSAIGAVIIGMLVFLPRIWPIVLGWLA